MLRSNDAEQHDEPPRQDGLRGECELQAYSGGSESRTTRQAQLPVPEAVPSGRKPGSGPSGSCPNLSGHPSVAAETDHLEAPESGAVWRHASRAQSGGSLSSEPGACGSYQRAAASQGARPPGALRKVIGCSHDHNASPTTGVTPKPKEFSRSWETMREGSRAGRHNERSQRKGGGSTRFRVPLRSRSGCQNLSPTAAAQLDGERTRGPPRARDLLPPAAERILPPRPLDRLRVGPRIPRDLEPQCSRRCAPSMAGADRARGLRSGVLGYLSRGAPAFTGEPDELEDEHLRCTTE